MLHLLIQNEILLSYDVDDVFHWRLYLRNPASNLFKLFDAEVQKLGLDLWKKHVLNVVVFATMQIVKLKPQAHHLGIEVRTRFNKLDVHLLRCLPC